MARTDQRPPNYQDPLGGNITGSMTLPGQRRPQDSKISGVKRIGNSFSASQRTQGGTGGGNTNIGDASGQANQTTATYVQPIKEAVSPILKTIGGVTQQAGSNIIEKGLFPTVGTGLKTLGQMEVQGAQAFANKRLAPVGKFLFGPGSDSSSIITPTPVAAVTPSPIITPTTQESSPTLGKFTTASGGEATVTRPGGASAFTPAQQSSLQATINREADPAFKARLAEQAAIVDARREQTRLGDIRRAGEDARTLDQSAISNFIKANPNSQGAAHAAQLRLGQQSEAEAATAGFDTKRQIAEQETQTKGLSEEHKARAENIKNYYTALSENAKNMGTPAQRYQIAKSHFGDVTSQHLPDILGSDFEEYSKLTNRQDQADFLAKAGITL